MFSINSEKNIYFFLNYCSFIYKNQQQKHIRCYFKCKMLFFKKLFYYSTYTTCTYIIYACVTYGLLKTYIILLDLYSIQPYTEPPALVKIINDVWPWRILKYIAIEQCICKRVGIVIFILKFKIDFSCITKFG